MSFFIKHPIALEGNYVKLLPLDQLHLHELKILASEPRIWEFYSINCAVPEKFDSVFEKAFRAKENGTEFPFVIIEVKTNKIIGSTRYLDIRADHRKLEIGWTWLHPHYWATVINLECKLLLLEFAFEQLKAVRVQLKTDEKNIRSRKAIEKIGGKFEGVLRNDMIRDNGTLRDSAYFSIIPDDWVEVKQNLVSKISQMK